MSLGDCSSKASAWELTAEGQLRLQSGGGDMCLTQSGSFAGDEDVAHGAPVHATSSSEESSHGAVKAVDGNEKTYWTSALDAEGQQIITGPEGKPSVGRFGLLASSCAGLAFVGCCPCACAQLTLATLARSCLRSSSGSFLRWRTASSCRVTVRAGLTLLRRT